VITELGASSNVGASTSSLSVESPLSSCEASMVQVKREMPSIVKKFYVVRKGYTTSLFYSWVDYERAMKGFSSAKFRSFKTKEEAIKYLEYRM